MKLEYRPYVCSVCGHKDKIQTNHEGPVLHYCKGCSWKRDFAGKENSHYISQLGGHTYRVYTFDSAVNESRHMNIKRLKLLKESMSEEQKKKLLVGLRRYKEEYTGNVGGETDIANADNLQTNENEFTSGESKPEPKAVAKTFDTKADFDSYVNQRRGIEMTPKEQQSFVTELAQTPMAQPTAAKPSQPSQPSNQPSKPDDEDVTVADNIRVTKSITFTDDTQGAQILSQLIAQLGLQNDQPTQRDKFFVKYESTDDFGNNDTTVIKKLREGNMFCWTAFSKHESAEEEGNPGGEEK